jgi:hypothetical protein
MPPPPANAALPNPIADLQKEGTLPATTISKLEPPLDRNDGTTFRVHFAEVPEAKMYQVWVATHADGRGAVNMTPGGAKTSVEFHGLRPKVPFYVWVTYKDAAGKTSKPSAAATITLVDTFGEK